MEKSISIAQLIRAIEKLPSDKPFVEPKMLAWLIEASGTKSEMAGQVQGIMASKASMPRKSSAIRKLVPWAEIASKVFGKK